MSPLSWRLEHTRLARPAQSALHSLVQRRRLVVEFARQGVLGFGEAAPLLSLGADDLDAAARSLEGLANRSFPDLGASLPSIERDLSETLQSIPSPSARFAVETAYLDALGKFRGQPAWSLLAELYGLSRRVPTELYAATLIDCTDETAALSQATAAAERGAHTLKLKLTPHNLTLPARVRTLLGPAVALRLDANRSLPEHRLGAILDDLCGCQPEFVEEPAPFARVVDLGRSPLPLALDESVNGVADFPDDSALRAALRLEVLVLKPTRLGGLGPSIALARLAQQARMSVVVSHCYEGHVAFAALVALAFVIGSTGRAQGLGLHLGLGDVDTMDAHVLQRSEHPGLGLSHPEGQIA